jgi:hypothetical protein
MSDAPGVWPGEQAPDFDESPDGVHAWRYHSDGVTLVRRR